MASSSAHHVKQCIGRKVAETEEIVRYMSSLPSYLESGNKFQDKALNLGVMDWGRLEKWHSTQKHYPYRSTKDLPSSSNISSYFSTDNSSNCSTSCLSCSPASQMSHRTTLRSHFNASPQQTVTPRVKLPSENPEDLKDGPGNQFGAENGMIRKYEAFHKIQMEARLKECRNSPGMTSFSKGKMMIQENESVKGLEKVEDRYHVNYNQHYLEKNKSIVLLLPRDGSNRHPYQKRSIEVSSQRFTVGSDLKSKNQEEKPTMSSECSDLKMGTSVISSKARSSPFRRFSSSSRHSSIIPQPSSNFGTSVSRADRPDASENLAKDNPNFSSRARSSPLRRLLDHIFPLKITNSHQSSEPSKDYSKMKVKTKLDLGSNIDSSHRNERERSEPVQALFQIAVKNVRPLFTFAVENNSEVLAATVRRLTSPLKDGSRWIYTFFTIQEMKKKNSSWLTPSTKVKGHGYVPHIVGQMKVSDTSVPNREFVLFSVNLRPSDQQILDVHPRDELAAIVVKFSRKAIWENGEDHFRTTVILPGGHHGVPSKGEPSPLIERWRSGGLCDCGGWDIGCRMNVLVNKNQTSRKSNASRNQFELFSEQGEFPSEGPFFSMSPLKESIYSVEFSSSLSFLQAFSTCISVIECRKSSQLLSESNNFFHYKLSEETSALI